MFESKLWRANVSSGLAEQRATSPGHRAAPIPSAARDTRETGTARRRERNGRDPGTGRVPGLVRWSGAGLALL